MSNTDNEMVEVDFDALEELDASWKIIRNRDKEGNGGDVHFLPKSQCEYDEEGGFILTPEWLAIKEGLV